jgi:lipoyl synthase
MTPLAKRQRGQARTGLLSVRRMLEIKPAAALAKPHWIRVRLSDRSQFREMKRLLRSQRLHTVCEETSRTNIGECFGGGTATFMILGDLCMRHCQFCDVAHGRPEAPDADESANLAHTVALLALNHVVVEWDLRMWPVVRWSVPVITPTVRRRGPGSRNTFKQPKIPTID